MLLGAHKFYETFSKPLSMLTHTFHVFYFLPSIRIFFKNECLMLTSWESLKHSSCSGWNGLYLLIPEYVFHVWLYYLSSTWSNLNTSVRKDSFTLSFIRLIASKVIDILLTPKLMQNASVMTFPSQLLTLSSLKPEGSCTIIYNIVTY